MTYIESKVLSLNDKIVKEIEKSKAQLVFAWIWGIIGAVLLLVPTIIAIVKTVKFKHTEYVLTEKKAIEKYGVFNVVVNELTYDKIENVTVSQSFWGRICNYGHVYIQGANYNNISIDYVVSPFEIKKTIEKIVDEHK